MEINKELEEKIRQEADIHGGEFVEVYRKQLRNLIVEELIEFAKRILVKYRNYPEKSE